MFWKLTPLSPSSPVESILDKENFTLEELLDEEEIIQEWKALNSRLINFLRDRAQVEQLLRYIVEEPPQDADSKRAFKFPFISCEILICEIDVILKTLVEEEELMDLLFSFLEPNRPHCALLAGYFSKVVLCLLVRKTVALINYVKGHQHVLRQLVDLIGITSLMEVLVRLVGTDDHVMKWLADSDLLEMIVDKLNPSSPAAIQANAAETLCAITQNAPSALSTKLSSPRFVARIFGHALEDSDSKSGLVHSLSVCISLLDPRRYAASSPLFYLFRGQHTFESPLPVAQETINAMLPKFGDLLKLLSVSSDIKVLPTTYGELRPPLGKHRLKIVEFIAVLMKSGNEVAGKELVNSGTIKRILDLFFEYSYNNALHHQVESIILSCLESKSDAMVNHILGDCDLIGKILSSDKNHVLSGENQPTVAANGKRPPRVGYVGHLTRITNKLVQLSSSNNQIKTRLQERNEWNKWQVSVLQEHNAVENVYRWACGRPDTLQDRIKDSDEEDRDYDVAALANNLSQAFQYKIVGSDNNEEDHNALDKGDNDVYFDDESAEVVISSLRLGDDQGSLFTNSNWFTFQDDRFGDASDTTASKMMMMEDINLNETLSGDQDQDRDRDQGAKKAEENSMGFFDFDTLENSEAAFIQQPPEWVKWSEPSDLQVIGSGLNPFIDDAADMNLDTPMTEPATTSSLEVTTGLRSAPSPVEALFEEDVEFVGEEAEGREEALKEGMIEICNVEEESEESKEYNDTNYWRVEQEVGVLE